MDGLWMDHSYLPVRPASTAPLPACDPSAATPPLLTLRCIAQCAPRAAQCSLGGCLALGSAHNSVALTTAWSSRGDGAHVGAKDELLRNLLEARGLRVELGSLDELQEQVGQPLAQPGERAL